ncbi:MULTISPECIES: hypothetical protein [Pseudomonadati]|uniref:DUF3352 domain-containing protein n=1 Tax=Shewanella aestuarii TaxID=1028752 RepID=A0ABT0KZU4_9GAMM|nr:hypothetical protein [Shewanella aestuarii]MCL1116740.1 hypothetical protein [Shewanella aestuarii]GGN72979.1 hypothetical protein GCM10009193_10510 [Shewanella aestuarii]
MNKMAVAVAILAVGAGGYYFSQQSNTVALNPILDYVPADTLAFSGQLTPFPIKDYLYSTAGNAQGYSIEQLNELTDFTEPHEKFFLSLYKQYLSLMTDPDTLVAHYGLPDEMQSYAYTLGALPVMKLQLADAKAFWRELDRAEQESGLVHTSATIAGLEYRAYRITGADSEETVDVVFAENQGWLTITLNTSLNQAELLETALGAKKVVNPISATTILDDIAKQHHFTQDSISFVNHVELIKGITTVDGNMLAKQITQLASLQDDNPFAELHSEQCKTELMAIANNWPRTVMGFNSYSVSREESAFDARVVIESKNAVILNALTKMRGFIPDFGADAANHILSVGLGMDVAQLAPSLNAVWKDLTTPTYQCQALAESQYALTEFNPAMVGMMTGMANGVKGLNLTVMDYQLKDADGSPAFDKLDALVSLSAENPAMLVDMVKPFYPPLAQVNLAVDGDAVDVTSLLMLPPEFGVQAKMAIRGQHLVLFTGDAAQSLADQLAKQPLVANGLVNFTADYEKMFSPLITMIEQSGEQVPEELSMMKDYNMRMQMTVDINSQGIEIGSKMSSKAPK